MGRWWDGKPFKPWVTDGGSHCISSDFLCSTSGLAERLMSTGWQHLTSNKSQLSATEGLYDVESSTGGLLQGWWRRLAVSPSTAKTSCPCSIQVG